MIVRTHIPAIAVAAAGRQSWIYTPRSVSVRLFFTAWLIYALHVSTSTVREIYPALSLGDHFSLRVDEYAHLHPDLFEKPGYGWHINSNPGASLLAAIPYAAARPAIDRVVARVNAQRAGQTPPEYHSPWPMAREFFRQSWQRGLDVKFGLAAIVIQVFTMAPISALSVVVMFYLLRRLLRSDRAACWLALLYGFGTPVFFRTGYLNHNLLLGHAAFLGFVAMWSPSQRLWWADSRRYLAGGLGAGLTVLFDYSGAMLAASLGIYCLANAWRAGRGRAAWGAAATFSAGAAVPIAILCWCQWASFGNPWLPAQHWIQVQWVDVGYKGLSLPMPDLLRANFFDYRFGLLASCPLLLMAATAPFLRRLPVPRLEMAMLIGAPVALWLFSSSVAYARLQFNSGVRYMVPAIPFLFVLAALALHRLPRRATYFVAVLAVAQAWSMAMYRDVERGAGVFDPVLRVFLGGFQLPLMTVLSRIGGPHAEYFSPAVSPLPLFALAACLLYGVWAVRLAPRMGDEA